MPTETDQEVAIFVPADLPVEDIEEIARRLIFSGSLVPGYIPPAAGLLDISAIIYSKHVEKSETIIQLDRNLASRMAQISRFGARDRRDEPTSIAIDLMAFAQAMDIQFDPSIAFHELAHKNGNAVANEELAWFRATDKGGEANAWIDLALERCSQLGPRTNASVSEHDLAFPLRRWERNYIVALKVARLELNESSPFKRALALLDWMVEEFLIAGPAATFSLMYFAPKSEKRRLMKHLRSPDRQRALEGVANAAWDITHLSNFVNSVLSGNDEGKRYIFATSDKSLASIAPLLLMSDPWIDFEGGLSAALIDWWPPKEARVLSTKIIELTELAQRADRRSFMASRKLDIPNLIAEGEKDVRSWRPA